MVKISEKFLLDKSSPNANKLEQIKSLDLSRLQLKIQDLPVPLLSRLISLEHLNLSGNHLEEFPHGLELGRIRYLDLSDNQIENVTTLSNLKSLEELKMEHNIYITVCDSYKLMVLLPNLRMYNGKDISTTANHMRFVYSKNLRTKIIAVWEKSFSVPDPITPEKMVVLEKTFVGAACDQVKYGPSSLSDFTKWRVGIMAKEFLHSLGKGGAQVEFSEPSETMDKCDTVSTKRMRSATAAGDASNRRPRKRQHADIPACPTDQVDLIRLRPQKVMQNGTTTVDPPKRPKPSLTTETSSEDDGPHVTWKKAASTENVSTKSCDKTQPLSLKPLHVLQCHSKQDSPEDFSTQLWTCAFQPQSDICTDGDGGGRLVATCGGDSLCVIDCETGIVMKKYKVPGEEFFTLGWSTMLMSTGNGAAAQHCCVLAAGGNKGIVKLIHPRNNVAFGEFRASRRALTVLQFHSQKGNFLFTGSYDKRIVMWDLGVLDSKYNFKVLQLLVLTMSGTPLHICLLPVLPSTHLLTASDKGLHYYSIQLDANKNIKRSAEMEICFPIKKKDSDDHTIDGLRFLSDDIVASKSYMQHSIYLWSWNETRAQFRTKKTKSVSAVLLAELQWAPTDIPYLALNTCPKHNYVVCGDDKGRLWTYHIKTPLRTSCKGVKAISPTEVLEWPDPMSTPLGKFEGHSINSVAMDCDLRYLVALSDKNMVVVWKRVNESNQ